MAPPAAGRPAPRPDAPVARDVAAGETAEREFLRTLLARSSLSWLTLPPAVEAGYRAYHDRVARQQLRDYWPAVVGVIAVIAAGLFGSGLIPPGFGAPVLLALAVTLSLVGIVVSVVRIPALAPHAPLLVAGAAAAGLFGMHTGLWVVPRGEPLHTIAQFGVILVTVAVFSISNLTLRHASAAVLAATGLGLGGALVLGIDLDWRLAIACTTGAVLVGAIVGFSQEIRERAVYLQGRLLVLEKQAIDGMALELERLSRTDALTGLPNRRHFDEVYAREWAHCQREGRPMNLLFIDVDYFKPYNDHYGHAAGDDCLAAVGRALGTQAQRAGDFVARYGGEEFVALFPGADREGLERMAARLLAAVDALALPHACSSAAPQVTVSVGIGWHVPGRSDPPGVLLQLADEALYRAKAAGRHRWAVSWPPLPGASGEGE